MSNLFKDFSDPLQSKKPRLSESLCSSTEMDHFAQMDTLDKKALQEMEDEVCFEILEFFNLIENIF